MAKATANGASMWLPAGAEPPPDLPDSVRLTGPGGAAAEQRRKNAAAAVEGGEQDVLWICKGCRTAYSVDAPRCPQCGSTDHVEQGSGEHEAAESSPTAKTGPGDVAAPDYDSWSNDDLRAELGKRRDADGKPLPTSGNKGDLAERLRADDQVNARPADAEGP